MYEKSIGADFRIYSLTLTGTPTLVYNLFDATTKADYNEIVGLKTEALGLIANRTITGTPQDRYIRHVVDGYVESYTNPFNVYSDAYPTISAYEIVPKNLQYTLPVYDWPHKTYLSGSGEVLIRLFFS